MGSCVLTTPVWHGILHRLFSAKAQFVNSGVGGDNGIASTALVSLWWYRAHGWSVELRFDVLFHWEVREQLHRS